MKCLFFLMLFLVGCNTKSIKTNLNANYYIWEDHQINGMDYRVFFKTGNGPAAICIVNLTKDKLEVRLLEKQLEE
jgi:hypothetical protein